MDYFQMRAGVVHQKIPPVMLPGLDFLLYQVLKLQQKKEITNNVV